MISSSDKAAKEIRELLRQHGAYDLSSLIDKHSILDAEEIAYLIDVDARARMDLGQEISVDLYVSPAATYAHHPVVLDAVIDMSLKSMIRLGYDIDEAAEILRKQHPKYQTVIDNAVTLTKTLWSTSSLTMPVAKSLGSLPVRFGPNTGSGMKRYLLEAELASGSSGIVYRASDSVLSDRDAPAAVAIKVFASVPASATQSVSYVDEAKKARRVSHPYVAAVIDVGRTNDEQEYIVYEYVEGKELSRAVDEAAGIRDIVRLVSKIAQGVQAIHAAGLAHCDIKPSNILIRDDLTPKMIDLGIAARRNEWESSPNEKGQGLGTLAFMSPQQYRGEPLGHSPPSDIWAIGGILFWMLTGRLPSGQNVEDAQRSLQFGLNLRSWNLRYGGTVPQDLRSIIDRALAQEPADRFGSAQELADALDSWCAHKPIPWTRPSVFKVFKLWCKRRPAIAALSFIALGGIFGAIYFAAANVEERRWRSTSREIFQYLLQGSRVFGDTDFMSKQLMLLSAGEWFYGPMGFRDTMAEKEFVQNRQDAMTQRLNKLHADGREYELESLLLESGLALWLVHDQNWHDAIPLIEQSTNRWVGILQEGDHWFVLMQSLEYAAQVDRMLDERNGRLSSDDGLARARQLADSIQESLPVLKETASGGVVRLILYNRLGILYGPDLLDEEHARNNAKEQEQHLKLMAGVR